jgi:hypothetical protein
MLNLLLEGVTIQNIKKWCPLSPKMHGGKKLFAMPLLVFNKLLSCACLYKDNIIKISQSLIDLDKPIYTSMNILLQSTTAWAMMLYPFILKL